MATKTNITPIKISASNEDAAYLRSITRNMLGHLEQTLRETQTANKDELEIIKARSDLLFGAKTSPIDGLVKLSDLLMKLQPEDNSASETKEEEDDFELFDLNDVTLRDLKEMERCLEKMQDVYAEQQEEKRQKLGLVEKNCCHCEEDKIQQSNTDGYEKEYENQELENGFYEDFCEDSFTFPQKIIQIEENGLSP